ncbi:GNAT family N-acetyltransferase [Demequina sp. NBRC 110055]|uniref:GNAT family N-acetyltransferase n=1 Tax=Demequina sp. NBRC 110055 TaxID=1570344 RepID=UPI0009FDFE1E|nr:GNAT family N-acetyltransferase [Demequina sp. NBRC 110055]
MTDPRIVPANTAPWQDLRTVWDDERDSRQCSCQYFTMDRATWKSTTPTERAERMRERTCPGTPGSATTGLIAYIDDAPAGWVAVEPRTAYVRLRTARTPWLGRAEDKDDPSVWAITCFTVRTDFRGRGLTAALATAAVEFAREHGAAAVEGYPYVTQPGETLTWGELYVGPVSAFEAAGMTEVSSPSTRRRVMRLEFA